jgi:hypothetical protein
MRGLALTLAVVLALAWAPGLTDADGRHRSFRGNVHGTRGLEGHRRGHRAFAHRPTFPVFVGPSLVVGPSVLVATPEAYGAPPVYPVPPVYPPPVYVPPAAYAAPPPPPMPRVVEFANGRYELRGDGVYSPYAWVWVPNPPAAPPEPPADAAPTEPAPARRASAPTTVYRWTDEQGVTTWTDRLEKVPARYRGQASRLAP